MRTGSQSRTVSEALFPGPRPRYVLQENGGQCVFDDVKSEAFASALSDKERNPLQN